MSDHDTLVSDHPLSQSNKRHSVSLWETCCVTKVVFVFVFSSGVTVVSCKLRLRCDNLSQLASSEADSLSTTPTSLESSMPGYVPDCRLEKPDPSVNALKADVLCTARTQPPPPNRFCSKSSVNTKQNQSQTEFQRKPTEFHEVKFAVKMWH